LKTQFLAHVGKTFDHRPIECIVARRGFIDDQHLTGLFDNDLEFKEILYKGDIRSMFDEVFHLRPGVFPPLLAKHFYTEINAGSFSSPPVCHMEIVPWLQHQLTNVKTQMQILRYRILPLAYRHCNGKIMNSRLHIGRDMETDPKRTRLIW